MNGQIAAVLGIPLVGGVILAALGHRRQAAEINIVLSALTFLASAALVAHVIGEGPFATFGNQFFVDSLNVFLVALTAFVALTTAIFSRPYMRIEEERGKLTAGRLRLFHSMYQLFTFTMLLVLLTNNLGVLWVATEAATLTTVLLVSLYRTPASLEAAWKYFILCGVGIAQALFGTILVYLAAQKVLGSGMDALLWTELARVRGALEPTVMSLAFVFLLVGYGTKVGLVPVHNWLPDAHAEGRRPCRPCSPACSSTSRCMRWSAAKCSPTAHSAPALPASSSWVSASCRSWSPPSSSRASETSSACSRTLPSSTWG